MADFGVPALEARQCIVNCRVWAQILRYDPKERIRKIVISDTRRCIRGGTLAPIMVNFVLAAELVFGRRKGRMMLLSEDDPKKWRDSLQQATLPFLTRDMHKRLSRTKAGREMAQFKRRFGMARWLVAMSKTTDLCRDPMGIRFLQFRGRGHHLEEVARHFGGRTYGCRCTPPWPCQKCGVTNDRKRVACSAGCGTSAPPRHRETPAHFTFGCPSNAAHTSQLYSDLAPAIGQRTVERMQTKTADQQWRILNRILDAQNEDQDRRVEVVLRAVFRFLNAALAEHPYYGKEKPKDKEGGKKARKNVPWKWSR